MMRDAGDRGVRVEPGLRDFVPTRVVEVELSAPFAEISPIAPQTGRNYRRAKIIVRLHGKPLGVVDADVGKSGLTRSECAQHIWERLHHQINAHLRSDGLDEIAFLSADGIERASRLVCSKARERAQANPPMVSVIVATHERSEVLARCVRSLIQLDYGRFEIIVVDNAPNTADTRDMLRSNFSHIENVRYVKEPRRGGAHARNRGVDEAKGEIIAFTDDDVVVDRLWVAEIVAAFGVDDGVSCVTGLVLPLELDTPAQFWFEEYGGFSKGFERKLFNMGEHRPTDRLFPYALGRVGSGNNTAWRASRLREIGGFDPAVSQLPCEDLSAFFDTIIEGLTIVYEPAAIVYHQHRREYDALKKQMHSYGVGLGAYVTRCVVTRPRHLGAFISRAPLGLVYLLSTGSEKNVKKSPAYPKELTRVERRGTLRGPLAYLQGRRRADRERHAHAELVRP
jgi:O-antigen biosynthesis protein